MRCGGVGWVGAACGTWNVGFGGHGGTVVVVWRYVGKRAGPKCYVVDVCGGGAWLAMWPMQVLMGRCLPAAFGFDVGQQEHETACSSRKPKPVRLHIHTDLPRCRGRGPAALLVPP